MVRPIIDMNPAELKYYPFMVSLNKCTGNCNVLFTKITKICVSKETKDINVKAFNMTTNDDKAKAMTEYISCDCKCKFNLQIQCVIQIENGIIKNVNVNIKIIVSVKKIIFEILVHAFVRIISI